MAEFDRARHLPASWAISGRSEGGNEIDNIAPQAAEAWGALEIMYLTSSANINRKIY